MENAAIRPFSPFDKKCLVFSNIDNVSTCLGSYWLKKFYTCLWGLVENIDKVHTVYWVQLSVQNTTVKQTNLILLNLNFLFKLHKFNKKINYMDEIQYIILF